MRTKFTEHSNDACSVKYQDRLTDIIENRTFIRAGHHVLEIGFNGYEVKLCEGFSLCGTPIIADDSVDLIDVIRKEYKILKREQSKYLRS